MLNNNNEGEDENGKGEGGKYLVLGGPMEEDHVGDDSDEEESDAEFEYERFFKPVEGGVKYRGLDAPNEADAYARRKGFRLWRTPTSRKGLRRHYHCNMVQVKPSKDYKFLI